MKFPIRDVFATLVGILPFVTLAAPSGYKCMAVAVHTLRADGVLVPDELFLSRNRQFTVDRASGEVKGGLLDNIGMKINVVDKGSIDQSFKVYAVTQTSVVHAMYLQINEHIAGAHKPFMALRSPNSIVVTGICE